MGHSTSNRNFSIRIRAASRETSNFCPAKPINSTLSAEFARSGMANPRAIA
jgi:hypothetical protein